MAKISKKTATAKKSDAYDFKKIEKKWQKTWADSKIFEARDRAKSPKYYCLDMFPYPSAYGIHVGHLKGYTLTDVTAKKKKMDGYEVAHPMGFDAFGLPAENFAIKTGVHPAVTTKKAIENIKRQLLSSGLGYDWSREVITCKPDYYRWTQWMFIQLYNHGLAYRKKAPVNFCPSCKTVLANEQVVDGKCERCSSDVRKEYLEQWFLKITDYAERLLEGLDKIEWPEKIKTMQRNWIGKSEGAEIYFECHPGSENGRLAVFTTRADTLFGCTYVVIAPENPVITQLKPWISNWDEVEEYIKAAQNKSEIERTAEEKEKTGVELKGIKAINPVNNKEIPMFAADYVLPEYGTGAVMAVPAHDQRDFVFAKKYGLPIVEVIKPVSSQTTLPDRAFEAYGMLVNSEVFSGLQSETARIDVAKYLEKRKQGKRTIHYKLRDWLISRQRYWGAPIPIVCCEKCGLQPVKENDLPVLLPKIKDFLPPGDGKSPLAKSKIFVRAICPKCGGHALRETDTMDTFVCSSWYFLRYADPGNKQEFASREKVGKWLPVDLYVGGAEHAVLHLLYSRFFTKALKDFGYIDFDEPFSKLFNQGTIYYQGAKMSKSKGNVVNPNDIIRQYGADTMRLYELFIGPLDQAGEWSDQGVVGVFRFLNKVWYLQRKIKQSAPKDVQLEKLIHKTVKKVTEDIDAYHLNTAISSLMVLASKMDEGESVSLRDYLTLVALLSPMAPHIAEEIWNKAGGKNSIFLESWPKYDPEMVRENSVAIIVQVNGKVRDRFEADAKIGEEQALELAKKSEIVQKWIAGGEIKKVIFIPGKLINIVV